MILKTITSRLLSLCFNRLFFIPTLLPCKEGERLLSWLCNMKARLSLWIEKLHLDLRGGARLLLITDQGDGVPGIKKNPLLTQFSILKKSAKKKYEIFSALNFHHVYNNSPRINPKVIHKFLADYQRNPQIKKDSFYFLLHIMGRVLQRSPLGIIKKPAGIY